MFGLTALELARIQFGFTISFQIIFPAITIGLASYFARSFAVIATRSAREAAFIFRIIRPLCAFTVISLMQHQTFGD